MRSVLICMFLVAGSFFFAGCSSHVPLKQENIEPYVLFNKHYDEFNDMGGMKKNKLPVPVGLKLPERLLSSKKAERELWIWFLTEGTKAIFKDVIIVEEMGSAGSPSKVDMVISPEKWTISTCHQRTGCIIGYKFRFYDKYGTRMFSIAREGRTTTAIIFGHLFSDTDSTIAMAQAMDEMMRSIQFEILKRKTEILSVYSDR